MWAPPVYNCQKYIDPTNTEIWIGRVELPHIGTPLLSVPRRLGPLSTRPCHSMQQAQIEAAESALQVIKVCVFCLYYNLTLLQNYYRSL